MPCTAAFRIPHRFVAILLIVSCLTFTACTPATGPAPPQPVPHAALIQLAVSVGTSIFLRDRVELAPLVWRIAHDAANATDGPLDVTQLGPTLQAAIARVPTSPETSLLAVFLVSTVLNEVQRYVTSARIPPTQLQLLASDVFAAIERAALARLGGVVPVAGG